MVDKTLYISGQLGLDTATGALVPGGVEAEAKRALDNMGHILQAAGISYNNGKSFQLLSFYLFLILLNLCGIVIKTTVLLADMNDFAKVNDIYRQCKLRVVKLNNLLNILIYKILISKSKLMKDSSHFI